MSTMANVCRLRMVAMWRVLPMESHGIMGCKLPAYVINAQIVVCAHGLVIIMDLKGAT